MALPLLLDAAWEKKQARKRRARTLRHTSTRAPAKKATHAQRRRNRESNDLEALQVIKEHTDKHKKKREHVEERHEKAMKKKTDRERVDKRPFGKETPNQKMVYEALVDNICERRKRNMSTPPALKYTYSARGLQRRA